MQQTVGRWDRFGGPDGRVLCTILFAFSAVQSAADVDVPDEDDRPFDWSIDGDEEDGDDRPFDWSIDEDEDDGGGNVVRSAAVAVLRQLDDDVYAGKMMAFFAKLDSLRRERRDRRRGKPESSSSGPGSRHVPPARPDGGPRLRQQQQGLLPPTDTDRDRKSGFWPGADDNRSHLETATPWLQARDRRADGLVIRPDGGVSAASRRTTATARRRRRRHDDGPAGYLHMGWDSARCVWRRYRDATAAAADDDDDDARLRERRRAREWLVEAARFWAAAVGLSVAALWSAFGSFHGLFCAAAPPPAAYARDVNRYLNTVPPHVVVTGRGKMFRYRPTAEERFLWRSAKKIAGFKV